VQDEAAEVARRTGALYLANTLGSIAGSLVAGFVLAPALGSQTSFGIFAACAALAPLAIRFRGRAPKIAPKIASKIAPGLALVAVVVWFCLPRDRVFYRFMPGLPPPDQIVDLREGPNEIVTVVKRGEGLQLMTNGHPMSGTSIAAQRYMRAFAHLPLLMRERPARALVICFGVGSTLHATSLHPSLERIEIADLSRNVLEHATFFEANNKGVLTDPRVAVFVEDGRQHLRAAPLASYDLITLEPPPILFAGVAALYSRELYELARTRLVTGGFMTQWLPIYDAPPEVGLSLVRAFVEVFPSAVLLSGWGNELILLGTNQSEVVLDLDAVEAALAARPAVAQDLARVHLGSLTDIAAMFVADGESLQRLTAGTPALTDDRPLLEYTFGRPTEIARGLFSATNTTRLERYCPKCLTGGHPDPRVADLPARIEVLERLYLTERFRKNVPPFAIDGSNGRAETIARSDYLIRLVRPTSHR
jgi:spermidine synthase